MNKSFTWAQQKWLFGVDHNRRTTDLVSKIQICKVTQLVTNIDK